jgi:NagD protein
MFDLKKIRHVVMDMDGTIYRGRELFPTTLPFLKLLRKKEIGFSFLTNNSSRGIDAYLHHLQEFGIAIEREQMISSTVNTADYLRSRHPDVRRLFMLGTESFQEEMVSYGFSGVSMSEEPDGVVTAFDTQLNYERLCKAAWWIKQDKLWIATHPDLECPTEGPTTLVDCGSVTACLEKVSGRRPVTLGKPDPSILAPIMKRHHLEPDELIMCGDRLYTDIRLAVNSGVPGILISPLPHDQIEDNFAALTIPDLGVLGEMLERLA